MSSPAVGHICAKCQHPQFFDGQHSPKDRCTHYVERLGAECGCDGRMRTGLDDGPPLPSAKAMERARAKIEKNELRTDAHRINWLESKKYFQVGLNTRNGRWGYEVRITENTLKRYFGGSLRSAIDSGMDAERKL